MMATVELRLERGMTAEEVVAEQVFKKLFIPRTLDDVCSLFHFAHCAF